MPEQTSKLGIKKPLGNETVSRAAYNENWDIIDQNAQKNITQSATAPSEPVADDLWIDTSTSPYGLKKWDGAAWQKIGAVTPGDIGAETPAGAQSKADAAEAAAKTYADQEVADLAGEGRTTETVKGNADALGSHLSDYASMQFGSIPYTTTRHVTYYIDEVNGDDDNDGLTPGTAFKTWAKTESMIPLICFHRVTIRIIDNLNETISISNRFCKSLNRITVRGDTTTPGDHQINGIRAYTGMGIRFQYLRINGPVILRDGVNIDIRNCEPRNPGGNGIEAHHGIYYIAANDFGNDVVEDAIYAINSRVFSANNIGNATRYGLCAITASTIGKTTT